MIGIIGTPSGGTMYISERFKANGCDIGHEFFGEDGIADWKLAIELNNGEIHRQPEFEPWYHKRDKDEKVDVVLHQVRHPLSVIAAMTRWANPRAEIWGAVGKFIDLQSTDTYLLMAMKFWLRWHELADGLTKKVYRVEDINIEHMKLWTGVELKADIDKTINTKKQINPVYSVAWRDLYWVNSHLARRIVDKAREYGYAI